MLIIGERINTSREKIRKAVEEKDTAFIQNEARLQLDAGANMLDVNCGTSLANEAEDLSWLVKTVQEAVDLPLCIDSPNPDAIASALPLHKGKALINSITLEKARYEKILPLVKKFGAAVVALTMDGKSLPETARARFEIAKSIFKIVTDYGIPAEDLYFDPMVKPVSSAPKQAKEFLESLKLIKTLGNVKIVGGLSNVSFGLPERGLINSIFLAMASSAGLDAALTDPLNKKIYSTIRAIDAIQASDNYCKNYINAFRKGKLK